MKERAGEQDLIERKSLCLPSARPGVAAHFGHDGFRGSISQYFNVAESNAAEQLVELKAKLKEADTEEFWTALMEGMTNITGAQYGFVAKRILIDDQEAAVEMPLIGEPGSCLLGIAFYYNDGHKIKNLHRDYKYLAFGAPCAHMRHDKVFLIPNKLNEFITNNPNAFPFPTDAYLGLPLFSDGKCFAHFGMMWTTEGLKELSLGWGYLEMLLHSLEDLILQRVLEGQSFVKPVELTKSSQVIPQEAVTASQSLKPYARSMSHELRTPMQGVVGMLDVMHATVQESLEGQTNPKLREIFQVLRENIEVVQDSSRRAVEAADNVVHAYDLNMQVPDTPVPLIDEETTEVQSSTSAGEKRPNILIEGNDIPINPNKRRRSASYEWSYAPDSKHRALQSTISTPGREISPRTEASRSAVREGGDITSTIPQSHALSGVIDITRQRNASVSEIDDSAVALDQDHGPAPGHRYTKLRELLHLIVNESLRVGGRPESAIAEDTERGEIIEVRSRSSKGEAWTKIIEWTVDPSVPETLPVDERDLAKLFSCVFLNAVKFTERGNINVTATLSPKSRFLVINVKDTGPGIPQDFLPNLFKAFSREDDSLTRQKEGLGLGLLVAKGLVRRIGGDLICVRSDTTGPDRGSEFELRVPISGQDPSNSRPGTPVGGRTPAPSTSIPQFPSDLPTISPHIRRTSTNIQSPLDRRRTLRNHTPTKNSKSPDAQPTLHTKASSPLLPSSTSRRNSIAPALSPRRGSTKKLEFDRQLALKHPLTFLVVEDNKINRKLLVNMLQKLGYKESQILEAFDGAEAVRQMSLDHVPRVDVVLMDLWMPGMDGYEATEKILAMPQHQSHDGGGGDSQRKSKVTVLAVSADVTDEALERAASVGMEGFMTKPYKLLDLERLIVEYCARKA
ncbi:MAG: hypothetical protein M1830_008658 [Pleopsidium flavum]|nr:MAG: hypothetical protein M1830_008658 [Pleopsidium flavum]